MLLSVPEADGWEAAINLEGFERAGSFGAFAWMVPGFLLVLPGLLLLLVVGSQLLGATIFIPITRRLLGRRADRITLQRRGSR